MDTRAPTKDNLSVGPNDINDIIERLTINKIRRSNAWTIK
nr:MAG: hypothetical protein AmFV_00174 [Apis mellifera filamentous virus]WOK43289.1 MAG: hypothetical protein [Apis mellifera filamentous virus]